MRYNINVKKIFQIFKKIRYKKTILSVLGIFILVLFLSDDGFNEPHIAKITIEDIIIQDTLIPQPLKSEMANTS